MGEERVHAVEAGVHFVCLFGVALGFVVVAEDEVCLFVEVELVFGVGNVGVCGVAVEHGKHFGVGVECFFRGVGHVVAAFCEVEAAATLEVFGHYFRCAGDNLVDCFEATVGIGFLLVAFRAVGGVKPTAGCLEIVGERGAVAVGDILVERFGCFLVFTGLGVGVGERLVVVGTGGIEVDGSLILDEGYGVLS